MKISPIYLIGGGAIAYFLLKELGFIARSSAAAKNASNPQVASNCRAYAERQADNTADLWVFNNEKEWQQEYERSYNQCMAGGGVI